MTWLSWFPDTAWKGAVVLLVAWIATRALSKQPAALRHLVWTAAFGGLLVMPLLSAATPMRVPLLTNAASARSSGVAAVNKSGDVLAAEQRDEPLPAATHVIGETDVNPISSPTSTSSVLPAWSASEWLLAVWLLGALAFGLRLLAGFVAVRRTRRAPEADDESLRAALAMASQRAGLRVPPQLVVSDGVAMPCAYGLLHPVVVLPADARGWSQDRLELVLLHEATHISRGDYVTHLLAEFARVLHWYNPLVWLASRQLRAEAERATDERVMHSGARASDYAGHLLEIVRGASAHRVPVPMLPLAQRSEFEGRLIAILEYAGSQRLRARAAAFTVAAAAGLVLTVASIGAAPAAATGASTDTTVEKTPAMIASPTGGRDVTPRTREPQSAGDSSSATSALVAALADSVAAVRLAVVEALRFERDTVVVRALMRVLIEDDNAAVRRAAAWSLGEIGDTLAVSALAEALLRDRDAEVRKNIASALGSLESRRATTALTQAMENDAEIPVRIEAANALGNIEDPAAVNALIRAVGRDSEPSLMIAILEALDSHDDARAAPAAAAALRNRHPGVRAAAAEVLSGTEDRSVIPALIAAARDDDVDVRRAVIDALSGFDDRRSVDVFANALTDSDADVRSAAANGLGDIEDLRTAPRQLISAMDDADADVRQQVAHALGHIRDPASLNALAARVRDQNADVRLAVVEALGEFGGTSATDALRTALRDANAEVREAAARALGNRSRK
jgi:HEAT repeat protein/beta-lactamase regulating signal transducer with metallopeptidase domain